MKKELKKEILKFIENMEGNTFLLPESWSEEIQMETEDFAYKTYVGGRGNGRYINIQITNGVEITFRKNDIFVNNEDVFSKRITPQKVYDIVSAIYKEKHSFKNHSEGERKIRKEITKNKKTIKRIKKETDDLTKRLNDKKLIKK